MFELSQGYKSSRREYVTKQDTKMRYGYLWSNRNTLGWEVQLTN